MLRKLWPNVYGALLMLSLCFSPPANAVELYAKDFSDFQRIITAQIEAFRTGDSTAAYALAAPSVRNIFPDARSFVAMVKRNYAPVFMPQSYRFETVSFHMGAPTQHLSVVDSKGVLWIALYGFQRQQDNSWKIAGVVIYRHQGADT